MHASEASRSSSPLRLYEQKKRRVIQPVLVIQPVFSFAGRGRRTRTLDTRFWRPLLYQLSYTPINMAEKMGFEPMLPLTNTNGLANRPLQPLEYFSSYSIILRIAVLLLFHSSVTYSSTLLRHSLARLALHKILFVIYFVPGPCCCPETTIWRRGWDSNPRSLSGSLVFKTSSINRSDTSPLKVFYGKLRTFIKMVTHPRFELGTP